MRQVPDAKSVKPTLAPVPWEIGQVRIDRVLEHERPLLSPDVLFAEYDHNLFQRDRQWLTPELFDPVSRLMVLAFHSFVIRTPDTVVLVDTCTGNHKRRPHKIRYHMNEWPYLERLRSVGTTPESVDIVICTHLHADHVGWNTSWVDGRWVPTFPNATYLLAETEFDHWRNDHKRACYTKDPYFEDSIQPVIEAGQVQLVEMDHQIDAYVRLSGCPGHTPGHVAVVVECDGAAAIMSGDIFHHPLQCVRPRWNSCFCVDRQWAQRTRMEFLEQYADSGILVMPAHFPTPSAGWIERADGQFAFRFCDPSDSIIGPCD